MRREIGLRRHALGPARACSRFSRCIACHPREPRWRDRAVSHAYLLMPHLRILGCIDEFLNIFERGPIYTLLYYIIIRYYAPFRPFAVQPNIALYVYYIVNSINLIMCVYLQLSSILVRSTSTILQVTYEYHKQTEINLPPHAVNCPPVRGAPATLGWRGSPTVGGFFLLGLKFIVRNDTIQLVEIVTRRYMNNYIM